ncbi:MAG: hypothetical protein AAGJ40_00545 [Planctomycetota bacterium]
MMIHRTTWTLACALVVSSVASLSAQPPGGPDGPGRPDDRRGPSGPDEFGGRGGFRGGDGFRGPEGLRGRGQEPPPSPMVEALDLDGNRVISEDEIAQAATSLKHLDQDGDGQLTDEEVRPPRPDRDMGQRGPGRPRDGDRRPEFSDDRRRPDQERGFEGGREPYGRFDRGGSRDESRRRDEGDRREGGRRPDEDRRRFEDGPPMRGGQGGRRGPGGPGDQPDQRGEGGPRDMARQGGPRGGGDFGGGPRFQPDRMIERAMEFDSNGDNLLSRDELRNFVATLAQEGPAGPPQRRGGNGGPPDRGGRGDRPARPELE